MVDHRRRDAMVQSEIALVEFLKEIALLGWKELPQLSTRSFLWVGNGRDVRDDRNGHLLRRGTWLALAEAEVVREKARNNPG